MASLLPSSIVLPWLVRLRWVSLAVIVGGALVATRWWTVRLPWGPLLPLLLAMAATNLALTRQLRARSRRRALVGGVLIVDAALLTGVLALAGGPINPFGIVYLVGVTIAATTLGLRWATLVAAVSTAGYAWTFVSHRPLAFADPQLAGAVLSLHLWGMWVALAAAAALIAYFVSRMSEALEEREHALATARDAAARTDRVTALLALGAGAAHELATPLSTIGIVAGELESLVATTPATADARRDVAGQAAIIRAEVERCTRVLDRLSGRAGALGAGDGPLSAAALVEELRQHLEPNEDARLDVVCAPDAAALLVPTPVEPLRQVLLSLLRNAFDNSAPTQRVGLGVEGPLGLLRFVVEDRGRGMAPEVAARAGEPFFTTRPGSGHLGLGLFLARAYAEQAGGRLEWDTRPEAGTTMRLDLPRGEA